MADKQRIVLFSLQVSSEIVNSITFEANQPFLKTRGSTLYINRVQPFADQGSPFK